MSESSIPRPFFLPGLGATPLAFSHQLGVFDGAVVLPLPGHGDGPSRPLDSVAAHAERLLHELERLPRPRVAIGHSLGGAIALQALLAAPDALDGLVIISAGAALPLPGDATARCESDFDAELMLLSERSFCTNGDSESIAARAEEIRGVGPEALLADYASCASFDIRDRLGGIQLPTLIVAASDDRLWSAAAGEELARGLPMAQMVVVEEAGHMVQVERPHAVNLLIAGYLARLELTLGGY